MVPIPPRGQMETGPKSGVGNQGVAILPAVRAAADGKKYRREYVIPMLGFFRSAVRAMKVLP